MKLVPDCVPGVLTASALLVVSVVPSPALAADAPAPTSTSTPAPSLHPSPASESPSRWYGWQTLAADGASLALIVGSIALAGSGGDSPSAALGWGALGTYALGAPVLHLVHANPGRAVGSLGIRLGGPILLGALGAASEDCSHHGGDFCGIAGALVGASVGVVAAVTLDAAVFAYDDQPDDSASSPRLRIGLGPRGVLAFGTF